jgi:hypothetical protein
LAERSTTTRSTNAVVTSPTAADSQPAGQFDDGGAGFLLPQGVSDLLLSEVLLPHDILLLPECQIWKNLTSRVDQETR